MNPSPIKWPEGKDFAFTVFDDSDFVTMENGPPVYDLLSELGFRTTKSVWPCSPGSETDHTSDAIYDYDIGGDTCDDRDYLNWVLDLQRQGFEIGFHNATFVTSRRGFTKKALDAFREKLGGDPRTYATHFQCLEGMYWGSARLSGVNKLVYNLLNRFRTHGVFQGQVEGSEYFWGDLCRDRIDYVRNFVFGDINTLKVCPEMPYFDRDRAFVKSWFASSEGPDVRTYNETLCEANQDQLEAEGGACIMYTHFGKGFWDGKQVDPTFNRLMKRLSQKNGWFVPVATLLDYLNDQRGIHTLTSSERSALERRWLMHKLRVRGSS